MFDQTKHLSFQVQIPVFCALMYILATIAILGIQEVGVTEIDPESPTRVIDIQAPDSEMTVIEPDDSNP